MLLTASAAGFFSSNGPGPELLVAGGLLATIFGLFKATPKVARVIVKIDKAADELLGTATSPSLGAQVTNVDSRLSNVESQIQPRNGEGTMREGLNRVEHGLKSAATLADEAKAAADLVAAQLVLSNEQAQRERQRLSQEIKDGRGLITTLLNSLDEYAATNHQKEIAYIRALRALGIDLTEVADRLEDGITDET